MIYDKRKPLLIRFVWQRHGRKISVIGITVLLALVTTLILFSVSPKNFPDKEIVSIKSGTGLSQAADKLKTSGIIRSPLLFKAFVMFSSGHRRIIAGDYLFDEPQSALRVAYRLAYGVQGLSKIKVTIFEGMTVTDIAKLLKKNIPSFDDKQFLTIAKLYEGYLFPDTYYFYENSDPESVLRMLNDTFTAKIKTELLAIQAFGKPLKDVVIMASIVEKEASNSADRRMIAGILWRRMSIGMPLQVDAPFYYLLNKTSSQLTMNDLVSDSPYNLYKHTGLSPTPIGNPGLSAIEDTINPTESNYLYFLSDSKGVMHYSDTHDGHVANKTKYIR